jgi:hypothetical protein
VNGNLKRKKKLPLPRGVILEYLSVSLIEMILTNINNLSGKKENKLTKSALIND